MHPVLVTQVGLCRQLNAANVRTPCMLLHTLLNDYPHFLTECSLIHSHAEKILKKKKEKKKERKWHSVLTQPPAIISAKRGIVSSFSVNLSLTKSFTCGTKTKKDKLNQLNLTFVELPQHNTLLFFPPDYSFPCC